MLELIRRTLGGGIETAGLRDDAASVAVPGGASIIVSVDSVVDGVHVDLALCSAADVGWKAVMGALSDLAAMGRDRSPPWWRCARPSPRAATARWRSG